MSDDRKDPSATQQLAALKAQEEVRRQYEERERQAERERLERERERLELELTRTRAILDKLHEKYDLLDNRLIRMEAHAGIVQKVGGVVVTTIAGLIVKAVLEMI